MGRAVGIDLGTRRIGVAVSDATGTLASPHSVIQRSGDHAADHRKIAAVAAEVEADMVVVGLPLSMDGARRLAATGAEEEVAELMAALPIPVETCDERLTTVTAARDLRALGVSAKKQRAVVDQVAAAVMLQAWLDGRRSA